MGLVSVNSSSRKDAPSESVKIQPIVEAEQNAERSLEELDQGNDQEK